MTLINNYIRNVTKCHTTPQATKSILSNKLWQAWLSPTEVNRLRSLWCPSLRSPRSVSWSNYYLLGTHRNLYSNRPRLKGWEGGFSITSQEPKLITTAFLKTRFVLFTNSLAVCQVRTSSHFTKYEEDNWAKVASKVALFYSYVCLHPLPPSTISSPLQCFIARF